jgi:hypothetical protein
MRTIGEIPHPNYKITVLHHNAKYTLQIEGNMVTQSYKFRESESINGMSYFTNLLAEPSMLQTIEKTDNLLLGNHKNMITTEDDSPIFEEII